jgi:two-component system cell cycle response regulator DivK
MARKRVTDESPLVLVVDSDADTRDMYGEFLTYSGFRVAQAHRISDAIEKAHALAPVAITTDISLEDAEDGCELCNRLKTDAATRAIPVVVVTAWVLDGDLGRAKHAGCDALLLKPCSPAALVEEIRKLMRERAPVFPGGSAPLPDTRA